MRPWLRACAFLAVLALATAAGFRIFALLQAERLAEVAPERALQWYPGQPVALWALAERRVADGDDAAAAAAARALLAREPLRGSAFRLLAEIDARSARPDEALRLYAIAAHRAPRDSHALSGLVQQYLQREDYPQALRWIDFYLRTSPDRAAASGRVLKNLVPLALDGRFASALVEVLADNPPWREGMLRALRANPTAASRVYSELQQRGDLAPADVSAWLDGLIGAGLWDEAWSRWRATLPPSDQAVSLLYNGDFRHDASGIGFDWHLPAVAVGALADYQAVAGTPRRALRLRFLGHAYPGPLLTHPLRLRPGLHLLRVRLRAERLRGAAGLEWQVSCPGKLGVIASDDPLLGSFGWSESQLAVRVPAAGCPGQWLRLTAGAGGRSGTPISGELWIDDARIEAVQAAARTIDSHARQPLESR